MPSVCIVTVCFDANLVSTFLRPAALQLLVHLHEELLSSIKMTQPLAGSEDAKQAFAHLARLEFYNQRMHRTPVPPYVPAVVQGPFDTTHGQSYCRPRPPQKVPAPEFTVGRKNAIGTSNVYSKVSLDVLRQGQVSLSAPKSGERGPSWITTTGNSYVRPDLNDCFQGSAAVRSGIAPRMPYSEVERRFAAVDSTRTMPGDDTLPTSRRAPPTWTEQQRRYVNPGPQPRREPECTLRYLNDIGSITTATAVPTTQLNATHYELGTSTENRFVTSSGAAHGRKPLVTRETAAGVVPPQGPSEVERGFFTTSNSRDYSIVSTGERLSGPRNVEAARDARTFCGHKQHPTVDPALRGPTGMRQARHIDAHRAHAHPTAKPASPHTCIRALAPCLTKKAGRARQVYDIVSGLDRPKELWW